MSAILVVGDTGSLTSIDTQVQGVLTGFGFTVDLEPASFDPLSTAAVNADLVVVAISADATNADWPACPAPVVWLRWDGGRADVLRITDSGFGGNGGGGDDVNTALGSGWSPEDGETVLNGLSDNTTYTVYAESQARRFWDDTNLAPAAWARRIFMEGASTRVHAWGLDVSENDIDDNPAPARRAQWPRRENHGDYTEDGITLLEGMLAWAADATPLETYTLTVNTQGDGTVARDPDQAEYAEDVEVTLTPSPDTGWVFSHWTGDGIDGSNENDDPLTFTMPGAAATVTAVFVEAVPLDTPDVTEQESTNASAGASDGTQRITWPSVTDAASYRVSLAPGDEAESGFVVVEQALPDDAEGNEYTFLGLAAGPYTWEVVAQP